MAKASTASNAADAANATGAGAAAGLKVTLTRSPIGAPWKQKRTAKALGLTKMNRTVTLPDNEQVRGMVKAIEHLVTVEQDG